MAEYKSIGGPKRRFRRSPERKVAQGSRAFTFGTEQRFIHPNTYVCARQNIDLLSSASSTGPSYQIVEKICPRQCPCHRRRHYRKCRVNCCKNAGELYTAAHDAALRKAPGYSWSKSRSNRFAWRDKAESYPELAVVGPETYKPDHEKILRQAPRVRIARDSRWKPGATAGGTIAYESNIRPPEKTFIYAHLPSGPQFSFGPRNHKKGAEAKRGSILQHGPSSMENPTGPGGYLPPHNMTYSSVSEKAAPSAAFGKASRFQKPGVQFISLHHSSTNKGSSAPGPRYFRTKRYNEVRKKKKKSRLVWR